jgi:Ca-activated chloride channel homolog
MHATPKAHRTTRRRWLAATTLVGLTALAGATTRQRPAAATPPPPAVPAQFTAPANGPVSLVGHLDRSAVQVGGDGIVRLELTVGAKETAPATPTTRSTTDLVVVLDHSGSMGGDKIVHARGAVRELISQLRDDDHFALVTYSSSAQLTIPLSTSTPAARDRWRSIVDGITPDGGTNMSSGIDLALDSLRKPGARSGATRVILISDGLANEGDASQEGLVARAQRAARSEISLTTVGVGEDFNEYLMTALADAGTGNYYFVQRATDLGAVFAREFSATRATVASNVAVEIAPASGVQVVDAAGYPLEREGGRVIFRPGTLFGGQERRIWVTLTVPHDRPAEHALGTFAVTYATGTDHHRVALVDTPKIACVATEKEFLASIDVPSWERAVSVDGYNKMQDEVARQVKGGDRDAARAAVQKFRAETRALNAELKSPAVQQRLDALGELEGHVDDAFHGPDQKGKQNMLSKSRSAAAYDARRAGSKF